MSKLLIHRALVETSNTLLSYSVAPDSLPSGAVGMLAFGAMNNGTDKVVFSRANNDSITITLPSTLTTALSAVGYRSLDPSTWSINPLAGSPGSFIVRPLPASVTLKAGEGLAVQLTQIQVDGTQGTTCQVEIDESIGDDYGSIELPVEITGPQLEISALASPATVTLGQPSTISFTATGGSRVELQPGGQTQTCTGPVYQGYFKVVPQPPSTVYTLTVYDDQGHSASQTVAVNVGRVSVLSFGPANLDVGFFDTVKLSWTSQYASAASLTPQTISAVPVNGSRNVQPGDLAPDNASEITFTLTLQGYGGPVQQQLLVRLQPMEILYFAVPPTGGFPVFNVRNGRGTVMQNTSPLPPAPPVIYQLVATGPGGPQTRYIGPGPWLECQYFIADRQIVSSGDKVTFNWQTLNATSATLNGQSVSLVLEGSTGTGNTQVTVNQTSNYVLVVSDAQGNTQSNQITITVM
jgi:hypothetical protein